MTRTAPALAAACLLGVMVFSSTAPAATETFSIAPGKPPHTTVTKFWSDSMFRIEISGTIVETDEFDRKSVFSAYHCIFGFLCNQPNMNGPQYFMANGDPGSDYYLPNGTPTRQGDSYEFVMSGKSDDPLTFAPIPYRQGNPQGQGTYSGEGFTFKVTEIPTKRGATFGFKVDGYPDRPEKDSELPEDLVGVEMKTSKTKLTIPPMTGRVDPFDFEERDASAEGVVRITTSYLHRTGDVDERRIRVLLERDTRANYLSKNGRRAVGARAKVVSSRDRHCPVGTNLVVALTGSQGKGRVGLAQHRGDDGRDCLSEFPIVWEKRSKLKEARISYVFPVRD
ncbi:MAG TPA: hypothetical protein VD790_13020 [Thermoleophilaceae bacterium]|nr:hypothetical protein [Thermoleophilaceae bacterium]